MGDVFVSSGYSEGAELPASRRSRFDDPPRAMDESEEELRQYGVDDYYSADVTGVTTELELQVDCPVCGRPVMVDGGSPPYYLTPALI